MIRKLLLSLGLLLSIYAWSDVRTDDETIQLECEGDTYWFQIDLERNEHLAWKYNEPKTPLILRKVRLKPAMILFEVDGSFMSIDRNTGKVSISNNGNENEYQCKKITILESFEAREQRLQDIKSSRLF